MSIRRITLEEEMKKNPQLKPSDIQSLREWCEKQSHLPKIEDTFLALFLHSNNYQMKPTKRTIEKYYTTRTHLSEFFCNRDPLEEKELRQAFNVIAILRLNGVSKNGYKMIYRTFLDDDPSHYIFKNEVKYCMMLLDMYFLMDGTNNGYTIISDASKLSFGHVARMYPLEVKKYLHYIQEAAPVRLKEIHIINAPFAMKLFMTIAKPFMKKELMNMIHFHSSMESISEYIPVDALPNEMGGKAGSVQELAEIQVKQLEDCSEWFLLDEATRRVNEMLRIRKGK